MIFNLVREPCIPISRGGEGSLASLLDTLLDAGSIDGLAPAYPTQLPVILRQLLLPVVLDALGPPRTHHEWQRMFSHGQFHKEHQERIEDYLDEYGNRFDLFDPRQPFAQVAELRTGNGETKPISLIVPSTASSDNVPLFSSRTEAGALELAPADALLWLLHAHCWDTAASKTGAAGDPMAAPSGKTTGNPIGPLGQLGVVIPVGRTLFETIMLNLPIQRDGRDPDDCPQWRRPAPDATWEQRAATGLLDLLTWQSRRIRLFDETGDDGRVRVTRVIVAAGDRLARLPTEFEPHTTWRVEPKARAGQSPLRPHRHVPGQAAWRGLDALLALGRPGDRPGLVTSILLRQVAKLRAGGWLPDDYPLQVQTAGIQYGSQYAVAEGVVADSLPLPVAALSQDTAVRNALLDITDQAERLAETLNLLSADLRRAHGGRTLPWERGQRPGELLMHTLDSLVQRLMPPLRRAGEDPELVDMVLQGWQVGAWRAARDEADKLLAHVPPTAFNGREVEERRYRAATAEQSFHRQVRRVLPRAAARADQTTGPS